MPQLILPSPEYKDSFIAAVREFQAENNSRAQSYQVLDMDLLQSDFDSYLQQLENKRQGIGLPEGYVAATNFWLVDNGEYIGKLDIRHQYTDYLHQIGGIIGYDIRPSQRGHGYGKLLLKLGLEQARQMDFDELIITCDVDNLASRKVMEANGGQLVNQVPAGAGLPDKLRFSFPMDLSGSEFK